VALKIVFTKIRRKEGRKEGRDEPARTPAINILEALL
jgi:hypothetical protein